MTEAVNHYPFPETGNETDDMDTVLVTSEKTPMSSSTKTEVQNEIDKYASNWSTIPLQLEL